jgi:hypothetical protein
VINHLIISFQAVKHLPLSSQIEYEQLLQKMKVIEEARSQKHKARLLKRTKSISKISEPPDQQQATSTASDTSAMLLSSLSQQSQKSNATEAITENLTVISQLNADSQQRILKKCESNLNIHR